MRLRHIVRGIALALSVTTLCFAASADTAGAQTFVETQQGTIKKLVEANATKDELTKAIDTMLDYEEITRRSLGSPCPATIPNCTNHWTQLSADDQKEFINLYTQLVQKKVRENAQKTKDFDVTYRGTKEAGNDLNKVKTEAKDKTKPRDPPTQVDYLVKGDSTYKVIDLVTEGSVLSKNYYDQSHKILTTDGQGVPYLKQKLKDRIAGKKSGSQ
ncbi:MAG: ABC transporter substrate-binding protein [Labilithrix sp.]